MVNDESEIFGICDDDYLEHSGLIGIRDIGLGYHVLQCKCEEFYPNAQESCTVTWNYFCNENFVAGYGEQMILTSKDSVPKMRSMDIIRYNKPPKNMPNLNFFPFI